MLRRQAFVAFLLVLCGSIVCHAATIDSGLFTTYTTDNAKTTLYWTVCGSIGTGSGCYSFGSVTPFGKIGSIIEGSKSYNISAGTVTRFLYVIDQEYGPPNDGVAGYPYKRVDTISSSYDTTTVPLQKTVSLPFAGGGPAALVLGGDNRDLVVRPSPSTR